MGYRAKSLVTPAHADAINRALTPSAADLAKARKLVAAFERARAAGRERASVGGRLVEVPIYAAAKRLLGQGSEATFTAPWARSALVAIA